MTSNKADKEAYVWVWLPETTDSVVAGKLEADIQGNVHFNYGKSYLERVKDMSGHSPLRTGATTQRRGVATAGRAEHARLHS